MTSPEMPHGHVPEVEEMGRELKRLAELTLELFQSSKEPTPKTPEATPSVPVKAVEIPPPVPAPTNVVALKGVDLSKKPIATPEAPTTSLERTAADRAAKVVELGKRGLNPEIALGVQLVYQSQGTRPEAAVRPPEAMAGQKEFSLNKPPGYIETLGVQLEAQGYPQEGRDALKQASLSFPKTPEAAIATPPPAVASTPRCGRAAVPGLVPGIATELNP